MDNNKNNLEPQELTYNATDDAFSLLSTVQMVVWENGLCIAGFNEELKPITAKQFKIENWNKSDITNIIVNEPLVAGPQPVTHIWIGENRQLITPQPLFKPEEADIWLRQLHFVNSDEGVFHSSQPDMSSTISFPLANDIAELLGSFFEDTVIGNFSIPLIADKQPAKALFELLILNNTCWLSFYQNEKLQSHTAHSYSHIDDCIYAIGQIMQTNKIAQNSVDIAAVVISEHDLWISELKAYFPQINIAENQSANFVSLLNLLSKCV